MSDLLEERKARVRAEYEAQCAKVRVGRKIPEWKGKTNDTSVPEPVQLRITRTFENRCYLSHRQITTEKPQMEHVIPLSEGGDNHEYNIRPALSAAHKIKSAIEAGQRAKADAVARAKMGMKKKGPKIPSPVRDKPPAQNRASSIEPGSKLAQIRALREAQYG